jgi:DNA-directed RNA polymerase specialized sigma24 family protein
MTPTGSVTYWIHQLKRGDREAAGPLWGRYFRLLVERARRKLRGAPRGAADEEDAALAAFERFCRAAAQGRFPKLEDRDDLWQILLRLTDDAACDQRRRETSDKRGGGLVRNEAGPPADGSGGGDSPLLRLASREPSPEFAAQVADNWERLFALLRDHDPRLVKLARLKMENYGLEEIARQLGCSTRSVQRELQTVRRIWQEESGHE